MNLRRTGNVRLLGMGERKQQFQVPIPHFKVSRHKTQKFGASVFGVGVGEKMKREGEA